MAASLAEPFALEDEDVAVASVLEAREVMLRRAPHGPQRGESPLRVRSDVETRWLTAVVRDLNRLLTLPEGWDSYGAAPIREDAAAGVIKLLARLGADVAAPLVAPMSNGGLLLEWNSQVGDLEIEVEREDRINFLAEETGTGPIFEEEGLSQARFLAEFRSRVSHLIPRV